MDEREQSIQIRAYQIWEAEGRPDGCDRAHWLSAEADVAAQTDAVADADAEKSVVAASDTPVAAPAPAPEAAAAPKKRRRKSV